MNKTLLLAKAALLIAALLLSFQRAAAQGPFTCSSLYYITASSTSAATSNTQLYQGAIGSTTLIPIGPATVSYNASAYNELDNYLYGVAGNQLIRVANDGSVTMLGTISGGGFISETTWVVACFLPTGELIMRGNSSATAPLFKINISTRVATVLSTALTIRVSDLVYSSATHLLYGTYNTTSELVSIDPSTGAVTVIGVTSPFIGIVSGLVADYAGEIYGFTNSVRIWYKINRFTAAATVVGSFSTVLPNTGDAAGCPLSGVLPVELVSFEVSNECEKRSRQISWSTASEVNSREFVVYSSVDNVSWVEVSRVPAKHESTRLQPYSCHDYRPSAQAAVYYKLRQINDDGTYTESNIVAAKKCGDEAWDEIMAYPNPMTDNKLVVQSPFAGSYRLCNMMGQTVLTGELSVGVNQLGVQQLAQSGAGYYLIAYDTAGVQKSKKLVVRE